MPFSGALTATVLVAQQHDAADGALRAPAVRRRARHGAQRLLRVHDRPAGQRAVADGARHGLLGRRAVPARVGHAAARAASRWRSRAPLRSAAAAGIGLLLTFIGLRNAGLVVGDPATLVRMGTLDHRAAFLLLGILVAVALMRRQNPLAFLAAIFVGDGAGLDAGVRAAAGARW